MVLFERKQEIKLPAGATVEHAYKYSSARISNRFLLISAKKLRLMLVCVILCYVYIACSEVELSRGCGAELGNYVNDPPLPRST